MISRKHAAPATLTLFLGTVATYLVQVITGGEVVTQAIGLIPARVSNPSTPSAIGSGQLVPAWLTLVSYIFPHGAWWHVTMNMAGLWFFGRLAEPIMGTKRFLFAYLASGVATGLAVVSLGPHWTKPAAGASGAISGILGAFLALSLPRCPMSDHRNLAVLGIELASLLDAIAWYLGRIPSSVPDRMSALMWHLTPFLAGWLWVRVWRQVAPGT